MMLATVYTVSMIVGVSTLLDMLMQFSVMGDWLRDSNTSRAVKTDLTRNMVPIGLVGILAWTITGAIHLYINDNSSLLITVAAVLVYGGFTVWTAVMLGKVWRYRVTACSRGIRFLRHSSPKR